MVSVSIQRFLYSFKTIEVPGMCQLWVSEILWIRQPALHKAIFFEAVNLSLFLFSFLYPFLQAESCKTQESTDFSQVSQKSV